jgi:hypothetical protein
MLLNRLALICRVSVRRRSSHTTHRLLILKVNSRATGRCDSGLWRRSALCRSRTAFRTSGFDVLPLQVSEFRGRVSTTCRRDRHRHRRLALGRHCGFRSQWLGRDLQRIWTRLRGRCPNLRVLGCGQADRGCRGYDRTNHPVLHRGKSPVRHAVPGNSLN